MGKGLKSIKSRDSQQLNGAGRLPPPLPFDPSTIELADHFKCHSRPILTDAAANDSMMS